ncbi:MAG TPA: PQQ-binding-like beta-propeller repeat protein, partial [Hyphomicrobiales bacterium]|nr:PQQ-binding-like beta-propeller repeat protein [Hyphomicrobiales bacterium]
MKSPTISHKHALGVALGIGLAALLPPAWAQEPATGSVLFDGACAHCHGANGLGGQIGPSIVARVLQDDDAALGEFLRTGSPERGMPPAAVSAEQLPALIDHLRFLATTAQQTRATTQAAPTQNRNRRVEPFTPVTEAELLQPNPGDWLWFSRTADAQRYSPLAQIDRGNVAALGLAWSRGLPDGLSYTIPLVHDGVMYLATPTSTVQALDATTGDLIWEYQRQFDNPALANQNRAKTLAMFEDLIYFTAPDNTLIAIDAVDGSLRWEAPVGRRGNSAGVIVVKDKVISAGNCGSGPRDACFISAHDARSGQLLWSFNTVQGPDDPPGGDTWAGVPLEQRLASPWGLPGSYDPATNLIYWGIANPMPTSRLARHGEEGLADVANAAPSDLYSNSTVALDPDTGELQWYYQHLPGDDWDLDMNEERTLVRTALNPDPDAVRWINPRLQPGEVRDVVVNVGEGGGLWALDAKSGEFLWATPFPFAPDNFMLEDIDVDTGITHINRQLLLTQPGERKLVCYLNTRSFWPSAYSPLTNALYV